MFNRDIEYYVGNNPVKYVDPDGRSDAEPLQTSEAGLEFIKTYEQFQSKSYKPTPTSNETIGYGHEIKPGENFTILTEEEATALLRKDIKWVEDGINKNYEGDTPLTQQQFDALVSLGVNLGRQGLINSDAFGNAEENETNTDKLLEGFTKYNTSQGNYLLGLDRRRNDEAEMYIYGDYVRDDDLSLDNKSL